MKSKVSDCLSAIADLFQVASFLGLTGATIFSLFVLVLGWFSPISIFWVLATLPLSFATTLYLIQLYTSNIGFVSLTEGSRLAYEELRGTLWGKAAEQLRIKSSPEAILEYLATGIVAEDIPVLGKYLPSQKLEEIEPREIRSGSIVEGAKTLELRDSHRSRIVDLTIRKSDLKKAIKRMKEADKVIS